MSETVGYWLLLDKMHISRTRATYTDTDIVSFTAAVDDHIVPGGVLTKDLGDVKDGDHDIGLRIPVVLSNPAATVKFSYQIVNSGFHRSDAGSVKGVMDELSDKAAQLCTGLFGYKNVWDKLNQFTHWLNNLQFVNCDGMVAADAIAVSGNDLQGWTAQTGSYYETRQYPGTDSAVGCGANSLYFVGWSVTKMSREEIQRVEMTGGTSM